MSLIELMVSTTIGLLLLVSLSSMFINQNRARTELDKSNRMIDNGRYALELLSSNLSLAGFYGRYDPRTTTALTQQFDPCNLVAMATPAQSFDLMRMHIQGFNAATTASQIASPPCTLTYTPGTEKTVKPGSDILAMRRVNTNIVFAQNVAPTNGAVYLQISGCEFEPGSTRYLMSANPASMMLHQKNDTTVGNCYRSGGALFLTPPYESLWTFMTEVYFVSPDNNPGDGIPTLKRLELCSPLSDAPNYCGGTTQFFTTPLVEGVEFMQVEYGIDSNGDNVPETFDQCSACTPQQWADVVSVKLHLITRNNEQTRGYTDPNTYSLGLAGNYTPTGANAPFKRHAYTQHIRLTNPSGRRETP